MLVINVETPEEFNEETNEFVLPTVTTLVLEHSLASLSKWESKFEKPFLGKDEKTSEEVLAYIEMMCLSDISPRILANLSTENVEEINAYISAKMTATWFTDLPGSNRPGAVVTAELIYYAMITHNIPLECQYWHLNKLLTLIRVFNEKNAPPKKMSRQEAAARQRQLNEERRARYGTNG